MPFARLTVLPSPTNKQAAELAARLSRLIVDDLRKQPGLTSVLIEAPPSALWNIGDGPRMRAAHLEVCVTAGTNSAAEKQAFIANGMALLREILGDLDPATYVVVREQPATDWGYDGRTQADRRAEIR